MSPELAIKSRVPGTCVSPEHAWLGHQGCELRDKATPKAAVQTLMQYMASEEGCHGVRTNAVALGWIDAGVGSTTDADASLVEALGEEELKFWMKHTSLGRAGTADELASAILFLASNEAGCCQSVPQLFCRYTAVLLALWITFA